MKIEDVSFEVSIEKMVDSSFIFAKNLIHITVKALLLQRDKNHRLSTMIVLQQFSQDLS